MLPDRSRGHLRGQNVAHVDDMGQEHLMNAEGFGRFFDSDHQSTQAFRACSTSA